MSSTISKKYSLIIPCFNEAHGLAELINACQVADFPSTFEVILVDNGSTDDTQKLLTFLLDGQSQIRSVRLEKNEGYGNGILCGLAHAKGDVLGWSHADLQTNPADFKKAIEIYEKDGSHPFVKGGRYGRSVFDLFFTISMSLYASLILKTMLWDINAQPNVFSREFYKSWESPPKDFALDLYVYVRAKRAGKKICRFPVYFAKRKYGLSRWNKDLMSKLQFIRRTIIFIKLLKRNHG